ncbi:hypothetical protein [Nocardia sp. NBC_01327]|uniref:hypothetical protein n=1 Tax=Nocardia sp. NBC_01327 TaxID=2903593 RepID=UPI002E0E8445|nr:hypothetical protein OG326_01460 [Nocardia sp. NBC_01327]
MTTIKNYFGITGAVPFVDVKVETDNRMFLDPRRVRLAQQPHPHARNARLCLNTFFTTIASCVMSSNPADQHRGLDLLQHFGEPRETRLGMSRAGIDGHGGAGKIGRAIWDALSGPELAPLWQVGIMHEVETIPLFVTGVDKDITSDLTTRIIFGPLIDFTAEVVANFPQFKTHPHGLVTVERPIWDPKLRGWVQKRVELPVAAGQPLVLVPAEWAASTLLMSSGRYHDTAILGWVQDKQSVLRNGKVLKTPKHELRRQPGLGRGRRTDISWTLRALEEDEYDLLGRFTAWVDSKYNSRNQGEAA